MSAALDGRSQSTSQYSTLINMLPSYAAEYVPGAFSGDVDAALSLIYASPNSMRPTVVVELYQHYQRGGSRDVASAVLNAAWEHDHHYMQAALSKRSLRELFMGAGSRPRNFPKKITVYRGGRGSVADVRRGWSWTTDHEVACWFAVDWFVNSRGDDAPLVVSATIDASRIIHQCDDRDEHEVLIFGVRNAAVDGCLDDWTSIAKELRNKRQKIADIRGQTQ